MSNSCALHAAVHRENRHVESVLKRFQLNLERGLASLTEGTNDFREFYSSTKSSLEKHMSLENKYDEMYRLLEIMESESIPEVDS